MEATMATPAPATFATLLQQAVNEPGTIHEAYTTFWNYSFGNQLLALAQCYQRGIARGPIATYPKWQSLGRQVRRGEKAIVLCQPVTIKCTIEGRD
jgi:antirestriction factor ArdC-like protein